MAAVYAPVHDDRCDSCQNNVHVVTGVRRADAAHTSARRSLRHSSGQSGSRRSGLPVRFVSSGRSIGHDRASSSATSSAHRRRCSASSTRVWREYLPCLRLAIAAVTRTQSAGVDALPEAIAALRRRTLEKTRVSLDLTPNQAELVRWSPDGTVLATVAAENLIGVSSNRLRVHVVPPQSVKGELRYSSAPTADSRFPLHLLWSPDSTYLSSWFRTLRGSRDLGVTAVTVDVAGRQVTPAIDGVVSWSPDGRLLAALANRQLRILEWPSRRVISQMPAMADMRLIEWSSDSSMLVAVFFEWDAARRYQNSSGLVWSRQRQTVVEAPFGNPSTDELGVDDADWHPTRNVLAWTRHDQL